MSATDERTAGAEIATHSLSMGVFSEQTTKIIRVMHLEKNLFEGRDT